MIFFLDFFFLLKALKMTALNNFLILILFNLNILLIKKQTTFDNFCRKIARSVCCSFGLSRLGAAVSC